MSDALERVQVGPRSNKTRQINSIHHIITSPAMILSLDVCPEHFSVDIVYYYPILSVASSCQSI